MYISTSPSEILSSFFPNSSALFPLPLMALPLKKNQLPLIIIIIINNLFQTKVQRNWQDSDQSRLDEFNQWYRQTCSFHEYRVPHFVLPRGNLLLYLFYGPTTGCQDISDQLQQDYSKVSQSELVQLQPIESIRRKLYLRRDPVAEQWICPSYCFPMGKAGRQDLPYT